MGVHNPSGGGAERRSTSGPSGPKPPNISSPSAERPAATAIPTISDTPSASHARRTIPPDDMSPPKSSGGSALGSVGSSVLGAVENAKNAAEKAVKDTIKPPPPPKPPGQKDYGDIRPDQLAEERRAEQEIVAKGGSTPGNATIKTENLVTSAVEKDHAERTEGEPQSPHVRRDDPTSRVKPSATGN